MRFVKVVVKDEAVASVHHFYLRSHLKKMSVMHDLNASFLERRAGQTVIAQIDHRKRISSNGYIRKIASLTAEIEQRGLHRKRLRTFVVHRQRGYQVPLEAVIMMALEGAALFECLL